MRQAVILGIGNRLMEDDGIGVCVVEELEQLSLRQRDSAEFRNKTGNLRFVAGETDTDYCLDVLESGDIWIIVDGGSTGKEVGTVTVYPLAEALDQSGPSMAFHDFDLFQVLKRECSLRNGILITVEISSLGFSAELSEEMKARFADAVRAVGMVIDRHIKSL